MTERIYMPHFTVNAAAKAFELCKDQDPAFNLTPVIDLIRTADTMGFDIVGRPANP